MVNVNINCSHCQCHYLTYDCKVYASSWGIFHSSNILTKIAKLLFHCCVGFDHVMISLRLLGVGFFGFYIFFPMIPCAKCSSSFCLMTSLGWYICWMWIGQNSIPLSPFEPKANFIEIFPTSTHINLTSLLPAALRKIDYFYPTYSQDKMHITHIFTNILHRNLKNPVEIS